MRTDIIVGHPVNTDPRHARVESDLRTQAYLRDNAR